MQFLTNTNIDFMAKRKIAILISSTLILIGIVSLILHGGPRYGIDFLGGIELRLNFKDDVEVGKVREALSAAGFANTTIKKLSGESEQGTDVLLFIQKDAAAPVSSTTSAIETESENILETKDISLQVEEALKVQFPDNPFQETQKNLVGPKIGQELRDAAILAIIVSLILIGIYISWRFEFRFALGAVMALFHDVLITLGFFSILNYEINLSIVAAFLTIVGYSLNDTIVVFDRIRENLKVMRKEPFIEMINKSINQTLSRTILTSTTTLFTVVFLYFLGGEAIRYFAFAMIVGILVGTYSSIFVASPVVVAMHLRKENQRTQRFEKGTTNPGKKGN
ncbi:protein translocase subunit SecF [candidate division KSB1 bacterium]|nr:protein translocase subunit SecF [candidate division KSB1 bacterium]